MAKRKRLTPAQPGFRDAQAAPGGLTPGFGGTADTASATAPSPAPRDPGIPPIAQVARDSAASAALAEVSAELASARSEGRLIQAVPLDRIRRDHLVRDRVIVDEEEMTALRESLRARGQQTPVELVDLGSEGYGLISGWRRVTALAQLHAETGEARFAVAQALLRTPATSEAAYTSMVEENELRVGLSPYERARIVAKSVEQGVFPSHRQALQSLFATASRAKRSKIGSFLPVVAALDGVLRFPGALTERLGLRLSKALEETPDLSRDLRLRLRKAAGITDAAAEAAWLEAALARTSRKPATAAAARRGSSAPRSATSDAAQPTQIVPGVQVQQGGDDTCLTLTLSGEGVDAAFRDRLVAWLREQA